MYVDMYFLLNFRLKFVGQRSFSWRRFGFENLTLDVWARTEVYGRGTALMRGFFGDQKVLGPMMGILVIRILFF